MKDPPDLNQYLTECLQIDQTALEDEFVRVPSDLAYWNDQYAEAYQRWMQKKLEREQAYNQLWAKYNDGLRSITQGRVLVGEITAAVESDPGFLAAKKSEIRADAEKVRLHGIMDALRAKKDMLISLGAHIRATMGNDPMIRQQAALDRELRTT